jgi:secretion/DNA translocation related TadE-like protein
MILMMGIALLDVTAVLSARNRAQTAADAAALAAAPATFHPGLPAREAARRMAEANGARLMRCRCPMDGRPMPRIVLVSTEVIAKLWLWDDIRVRAASRAEFSPYPEEQ